METPRPALRGKYSIRNPIWNAMFRVMDSVLYLVVRTQKQRRAIHPPQRILISNIAHLGDVIMATALLPVLKSAYPQARISFLVGSWAKDMLRNHPWVDEIHVLDHWAHNRARLSRLEKFRQYLRTRRTSLQQIKEARYDVAFDFYWNFPNTLPLLWQAKIPMRVGYESGGFGPLATHSLEFGNKRLHAAQRFLDLVKTLPQVDGAVAAMAPVLPPLDERSPDAAASEAELREAGAHRKEYFVFHVGAADSFRDWPAAKWRELAQTLIAEGFVLVFTGAGEKDEARIQEIQDGLSGCINCCNRLTWAGFVAAIAGARLLVCVDTVAGHLAAAMGTPCFVITAGRWPYLWRPLGPSCQVLMAPVPCSPCHRNGGCAGMECVREVTVSAVHQAILTLIDTDPQRSATT